MQIDIRNFQKEKPNILEHIKKSSFIAFDFEFTGLTTDYPDCRQNQFQDEVEHYERIKQISTNFTLLQFGITCFEYNEGHYKTYCYNIYVRNPPKGRNKRNMFICDADSLEFLAINEMDFKRVFQYGVPSRRLSQKNEAIKQITDKLTKRQILQFQFLCPNDQKLFNDIQLILQTLCKQGKETIINFHSKAILNYTQKKYPIILGDKSKKPNLKQFEFPVKPPKGKNTFNIKLKLDIKQQEDDPILFLDKIRLEQLLHQEMGLSQLVQQIIQSKIPLVGHFNHLDLGFLYHYYVAKLPQKLQEFEDSLHKNFPFIFDTKVISKNIQKQIKGIKVDLESLAQACDNPNLLKSYNNVIQSSGDSYAQQKCAHQAGYDSYITGLVFACLCNFLNSNQTCQNKQVKNQKSQQIIKQQSFEQFNIKDKPKYPEINYMTFPGNHVIYSKPSGQIQFNSSIRSTKFNDVIVIQKIFQNPQKQINQICQILKQYGNLKVSIRDKIYIQFTQKQQISQIIKDNPKLGLIPYKERTCYRSKQYLQ